MHRVERLLVYPTLALLVAAVFFGLRPVTADAPADGTFGTLTVREVKVVGADGTVFAVLGADEDGGLVRVIAHPDTGTGGITLATRAGGGRVQCRGEDGADVAFLGMDRETRDGLLYISHPETGRAAEIGCGEKGGYTKHFGPEGKWVTYAGAASDNGSGILITAKPDGSRGAEVGQLGKGGYFASHGESGKQVAFLGAASDSGVGLLSLNRSDGVRTWYSFAGEEGGSLRILKGDGAEVVSATAGKDGGKLVLTDAVGTVNLPFRK